MPPVLLSKEEHKELKISSERSRAMGDNVSTCMVVPHEFRDVQHHFPIFFRKYEDDGLFRPMALLGLEPDENLFIKDGKWDCNYMPLVLASQPFIIGRQEANDEEGRVFIDTDSPRIVNGDAPGHRVFDDLGNETLHMQAAVRNLEMLHHGNMALDGFSAFLEKYDLLESFALEVGLANGSQNRLLGFYTINESKLAELEPAALSEMVEKGYMMAIFMVLASLASVTDLIDRKNRLL